MGYMRGYCGVLALSTMGATEYHEALLNPSYSNLHGGEGGGDHAWQGGHGTQAVQEEPSDPLSSARRSPQTLFP